VAAPPSVSGSVAKVMFSHHTSSVGVEMESSVKEVVPAIRNK
jgi:hypothetical protein